MWVQTAPCATDDWAIVTNLGPPNERAFCFEYVSGATDGRTLHRPPHRPASSGRTNGVSCWETTGVRDGCGRGACIARIFGGLLPPDSTVPRLVPIIWLIERNNVGLLVKFKCCCCALSYRYYSSELSAAVRVTSPAVHVVTWVRTKRAPPTPLASPTATHSRLVARSLAPLPVSARPTPYASSLSSSSSSASSSSSPAS